MNSLFGRLAVGPVAKLALLLDLLLVIAALVVASLLSSGLSPELLTFCLTALAVWLLLALALRHYDPWAPERALFDDLALTSVLVLAETTVVAASTYVFRVPQLPSAGILLLVLWPTALVARVSVFRAFSSKSGPIDEVLIVGTGALARATAEDLQKKGRRRVLGFVRFEGEVVSHALRGKVLGAAAELDSVLATVPVGEVYLATNNLTYAKEMQGAIKVCERFGVPFATPAYMFRLERARPLSDQGIADGYLHYQSVQFNPTKMAVKRAFDILASGVALWVLSPMFVIVAALIKLTSPGPVLFRQIRVGMHGRPFRMLKFRTMVVDAEAQKETLAASNEMDGPVFKIKKDPRITSIGRVLRKFSIDELPQLVNVLRGDMSVVGPRPPVPSEVARYEPWQRRRLSFRPGLTCIWQVSGRNQIPFEQWMFMDLQYIDNWSLSNDLALILKTVPVVLTGRGAS